MYWYNVCTEHLCAAATADDEDYDDGGGGGGGSGGDVNASQLKRLKTG